MKEKENHRSFPFPAPLSLFLQNIHVSLVRTVPPYNHQADVWVKLLKLLGYWQVLMLHSADTDGRALFARFQSAARHSDNEKGVKARKHRL